MQNSFAMMPIIGIKSGRTDLASDIIIHHVENTEVLCHTELSFSNLIYIIMSLHTAL